MKWVWKLYWCGFLLWILYGFAPDILRGRSQVTIRMEEGREQRVAFFQLFKGPLIVSVDDGRNANSNFDKPRINSEIIIEIAIRDKSYQYAVIKNNSIYTLDGIPDIVLGGNNIIVRVIKSAIEYKDVSLDLSLVGSTGDLKNGQIPQWSLNPISFVAGVLGFIVFGVVGFLTERFVRFVLQAR